MATFFFELVSPEKLVFSGNVEEVIAPGSEGVFTVLKNHAPVMTTLRPGIVEFRTEKERQKLFVRGGFADMSAAGLTILAEQAIPLAELSADQIASEISDAEDDVRDAAEGEAKRLALETLDRLREFKAVLNLPQPN
jgi:F-type H+-transporting ATPase subunit epsilon